MDIDRFTQLVEEALRSLPAEFLDRLENVQIDIEAWPTRADLEAAGLRPEDKYALLGLYHGVPLTNRGAYYTGLPDRITIFQKPIEAIAGPDDEAIRQQVRKTVIHEIAHYYGIGEERLRELGWA
ncbi:MAG: metallopeptidase family protein [Thermoleophilia bacterium]|nr:metallopeptidase family protein [Thermoleophilia bacterium]